MTWSASGRPDADPYTRAHTVRNGLLPLASTLEVTYQAKADSRGGRLHAGCEYTIVMEGLDGGTCSNASKTACDTTVESLPPENPMIHG